LPHLVPSDDEIRQKLMQVMAATGHFPDLAHQTVTDLIDFDKKQRSSKAVDPSMYSPIVRDVAGINPDVAVQSASSAPEELLQRAYYCVHGLLIKNRARVDHAKCQGADSVGRVIRSVVRNFDVMCGVSGGVQGVPHTYTKLKPEMDRMRVLLARGGARDPNVGKDVHMAARIVNSFPSTKRPHTRLSRLLTKLCVGVRNSLRLLRQQQGRPGGAAPGREGGTRAHTAAATTGIFLFLYLRTFGLTINRYGPSFCGLLCGAPGGGKSQVATVTLTDTVPSSFCRMVDGSSDKANTVGSARHERDFQINVSDEAPTNAVSGDDSDSSEKTKRDQSLYVNGSITYEVKTKNPVSGKWELDTQTMIARGMYVFCTNNPQKVARAIRDRSCVFDVVHTTTDQRALSASSAVATAGNPEVRMRYTAFKLALKFQCGLQFGYTGAHAVGIVDDASSLMYVVFESMLASNPLFCESLPARRGIDCLKLAEAIMIYDLTLTWHAKVGPHFNHAREIEILYYRAFNYISAEHIVASYSIMQQTTSTNQQMIEVMQTLKELVQCDEDSRPMQEGEYFVLQTKSVRSTIDFLKLRLQRLGEGLCKRIFELCQSGFTQGNIHIKTATLQADGRDYVMVLKDWINTVRSQAEQQIIRVLHEISKNPSLVCKSYDNEATRVVFRSAIRKRIRTPPPASDRSETKLLSGLTEKQLKMAIEFLCTSLHRDTNEPLFELPTTISAARYLPADGNRQDAVPSDIFPTKVKVPREEIMPLVVHAHMLDSAYSMLESTKSPIDVLFEQFLTIAGEYDGTGHTSALGPSVFAGVNQSSEFTPGHHVSVNKNVDVNVKIRNTLSSNRGAQDHEWLGIDDAADGDTTINHVSQVQHELFPPGQHSILLDNTTQAETKLASAVAADACIDGRLLETFIELRST
jgi:hypothetical protein